VPEGLELKVPEGLELKVPEGLYFDQSLILKN